MSSVKQKRLEGIIRKNISDIIQFSDKGLEHVRYQETEHFQLTRDFLANPDRMLRILLEES